MKENEPTMYFSYDGRTRVGCDAVDVYNWLLAKDKKLAKEFLRKQDGAIKKLKRALAKRKREEMVGTGFAEWKTEINVEKEEPKKKKIWWRLKK